MIGRIKTEVHDNPLNSETNSKKTDVQIFNNSVLMKCFNIISNKYLAEVSSLTILYFEEPRYLA